MNVSRNWIQQYLNFDLPANDELVQMIGAQLGGVEQVIDLGAKYQKAVVAEIKHCEPVPDSDHLNRCLIDDGAITPDVNRQPDGLVQVICGAPNARAGIKVVWLPPGATVPSSYGHDPFVLEARKLRGVVSNGMLASPKELALSDDHEGILELPEDAKPGQPFAEAYGLNDTIIDIENKMFTHRPDCFGQLGVAREVAGIFGRQFTSPEWYVKPRDIASGDGLKVTLKNELPRECPRIMLLPMRGVKVGPSPLWLQTLLTRAGMRPLNNVVDATNYLMLLTGQPTHAYDYHKVAALSGDSGSADIVVRNPHAGEKLELLNGKTVEPRAEAILIATPTQAIGLAGVMGGGNTEVDADTSDIILEVASFDMYSIRRTSMAHGVFTDAVTRFNKGQSPRQNPAVLGELVRLLGELAGATPAGPVLDDRHDIAGKPPVTVERQFINSRLGLDLSTADMATLLTNVEFTVEATPESLTVTAPFWRTDIELREDVVEEIGRLYGFDKLPQVLPRRSVTPAAKNPLLELKSRIRQRLARAGANEVLTYSFVHGRLLDVTGQDRGHAYKLSNALSPDLQFYRLSLMPSLLDKVRPNLKAGYDQFALFEIGKAHPGIELDDQGLPREDDLTALVVAANGKLQLPGAAYFRAQSYLAYLVPTELSFQPIPEAMQAYDITKPYDMSRSSFVYAGETFLGVIGEFRAEVRRALKLPVACAGFELDTQALLKLPTDQPYRPLSRFPKVEQDVCLKVPTSVTYAELESFVSQQLQTNKPKDTHCTVGPLDIYRRTDDTDHTQMTFRVSLFSDERTLTDRQLTGLLDNVAAKAADKFGAERI